MPMNAMMKSMFAGSIDTLNSDQCRPDQISFYTVRTLDAAFLARSAIDSSWFHATETILASSQDRIDRVSRG
jgi:hypothetical protein